MHNTVLTEYKLSINTTNLLLILPCAAGVDSGVDGGASNGVIPPSAQVESTRTYKKTGSAAPSTASQGARLATAAETSGTNPNPKFTPTAPLFTSLLTSLHYHYLLHATHFTTLSLFTSLLTSLHYHYLLHYSLHYIIRNQLGQCVGTAHAACRCLCFGVWCSGRHFAFLSGPLSLSLLFASLLVSHPNFCKYMLFY